MKEAIKGKEKAIQHLRLRDPRFQRSAQITHKFTLPVDEGDVTFMDGLFASLAQKITQNSIEKIQEIIVEEEFDSDGLQQDVDGDDTSITECKQTLSYDNS